MVNKSFESCILSLAGSNTLIRKCHMCTPNVKASLFKTYCTIMYAAHLWWNYRMYSIRKLNVAYNDIMRLLLHLPRHHSASQLFANVNVPGFYAVIRNLMLKFITRLNKSENVIISMSCKASISDLYQPYSNSNSNYFIAL